MSTDDYDSSYLGDALPAFIGEATEHLQQLEELLLQIEDAPQNRELLDALFRSAHTIKGSAGIFGLDHVVAFTHHVETLLEGLRRGRQNFSPTMGTLLLKCADHIRVMLEGVESASPLTGEQTSAGEVLVADLRRTYGEDSNSEADAPATTEDSTAAPGADAVEEPAPTQVGTGADRWQVRAAFSVDTFRNGMDPVAIIRYLEGQGQVLTVHWSLEQIPVLDDLDPEDCHVDLRLEMVCPGGREAIEGAFAFVMEDCELVITAVPREAAEAAAAPDDLSAPGREDLPSADPVSAASVPVPGADQTSTGGAAPVRADTGNEPARFIRVRADRLDKLIDLLGELVIGSASATLLARETRQSRLMEANQQVGNLVEEIRDGTLQLRMVPIGDTFTRFRRVVRDTAAELGKDIELELQGTDTELDKSVVERIVDPLMHLVRNSLDHGLETPQEREATGKPARGRLTLAASHESGSILIRIMDDGRGINRDKVLARARERGLIAADAQPTDKEIVNLIFQPGFSTAEAVTNLSGRGVGMDVVRSNIEALRGSVSIDSVPGQGAGVEIRLPLTLAIIDGFLVGVGDSRFIFPLDSVIEVVEGCAAVTTSDGDCRRVIELREQLLPVVDLRHLYELDAAPTPRNSIVVLRAGLHRIGVLVDTLHGQHQTVIKPLASIFRGLRGISGSTILGNGEVALIFDVASLAEIATASPPAHPRPKESA